MSKKLEYGSCEACGTEFKSWDQFVNMQLAPAIGDKPAVKALVCARHRTYQSPVLRPPCARKIRAKHCLCPGCGAKGHDPGELCDGCLRDLERVRVLDASQGKVKWYPLEDGRFFTTKYLSSSGDDAGKLADKLCKLLVKACAGGRRTLAGGFPPGHSYDGNWGPPIPFRSGGAQSSSGMPWVEMDEKQAEALDAFSTELQKLGDAIYRQGFEEGDNLLRRLALGQVQPDDYEQWRVKETKKR